MTIRYLASAGAALALVAVGASPGPAIVPATPPSQAVRTLDAAQLSTARRTGRLALPLPGGDTAAFMITRERETAGIRTYSGSSGGNRLLLTTDGTRAYGYALVDSRHYSIDTVRGTVVVADSAAVPRPEHISWGSLDDAVADPRLTAELLRRAAANRRDAGPDALDDADTPTIVDIAMFYEQAIADTEGPQAPHTRAQAAIDFTNEAIGMHGLSLELRLVYVGPFPGEVNYDPLAQFAGDEIVSSTAESYGADLRHLMFYRKGEPYCGTAVLFGDVGISGADCDLSEVVAHELGHNFNLNHDRAHAWADPDSTYYNFGYVCGGMGTLMAYHWPHVPHYSSPLLSNGGEPCGVPEGLPGAADNARVLNEMRLDVAAFRPTQPTYGTVGIVQEPPSVVAEEQAPRIPVRVAREGGLDREASVSIVAIGDGATAGEDFEPLLEHLVFAPGETGKTVHLKVLDDERHEADPEAVKLVLRYPHGMVVAGGPRVVSITSDDPDRGVAEFAGHGTGVWEDHGTLQVIVERIGSTAYPLTVNVRSRDDDAIAGIDYAPVDQAITFGVGESTKIVEVRILDDALFEGYTGRNFELVLAGIAIGANASYWVSIWNDDLHTGKVQFQSTEYVVRENDVAADVTIQRVDGVEGPLHYVLQFASGGTAVAGRDFDGTARNHTIQDGIGFHTASVPVYDNSVFDGARHFNLSLWSPEHLGSPVAARVTIVDDDQPTAGGGQVEVIAATPEVAETVGQVFLTVRRSGGSNGPAVVDYATSGGTATPGSDFSPVQGTLSWTGGDASDRIVAIPVLDDRLVESRETVRLALSNAAGATLGTASSATIGISSDDAAGVIALLATEASVDEEGGSVSLRVARQGGDAGAVGVSYRTVAGTAAAGADFTPASGMLTWQDSDTSSRDIVLRIDDDLLDEANETFTLSLSDPTGGATLQAATATVTIISGDRAPTPPATIPAQTATENVAFSFTVPAFSDANGDRLTYSFTGLPAWLKVSYPDINPRYVSGRPPYSEATADNPRIYTITVQASDPGGLSASRSFSLAVHHRNAPPVPPATIPAQTASEGSSFGYTAPQFSDADGDSLAYAFSGLPAWLTVSHPEVNPRYLSGKPPYTEATPAGPRSYAITMRGTDPSGASATRSFTLTVLQRNAPPTPPATIPPQSATEGASFGYTAPQFSDVDGDSLAYSFSGLPSWLKVSYPDVNPRYLSGRPPYSEASPGNPKVYNVTMRATDPAGASANRVFTVTVSHQNRPPVAPVIPALTATEGASFGYTVPAFSDPDGDPLTYRFSGLPSWLRVSYPDLNPRYVSGRPPYSESSPSGQATYSITVTATDAAGAETHREFPLTVVDVR